MTPDLPMLILAWVNLSSNEDHRVAGRGALISIISWINALGVNEGILNHRSLKEER